MKKKIIFILFITLLSCEKKFEAPVPDQAWELFNAPGTSPLPGEKGQKLQGVYELTYGSEYFGGSVVLKWVTTFEDGDSVFSLSGFFAKDQTYFISSGRQTDSVILLNGYYRKMSNTETGLIRLKIAFEDGARLIDENNSSIGKDSIVINGNYGSNPTEFDSIKFSFNYPMRNDSAFIIMAHRCGGRTSDLLPAAENSVKMVVLAPKLGATGVELDVRLTSDNVPIVYHDETLNDRLIQLNGMMGNISNYSFDQLRDLVRLTDGQTIPTLREILDAVLYQTKLRFVWLDIKYYGNLQIIKDIQDEYSLKAQQLNRDLTIVFGIPDDQVQQNFMNLANYTSVVSINERYDEIQNVNSIYWGAPWALGIKRNEIETLHTQNKKVIAWTMDQPDFIDQYISENLYDGILSNYSCTVAYFFYSSR